VIDTGHGMSEEGCSKLFVDFGKLEENAGMNKSGTGLGLSICKNIIEKMGGSVDVKSKLNKGTSFIIKLNSKCIVQKVKLSPCVRQNNSCESNIDKKLIFIKQMGNELVNLINSVPSEQKIIIRENEEEKV